MIEPTDEMMRIFRGKLADGEGYRGALTAVLAIVERDWNMQPRPEGSHLPPKRHERPFAPTVDPCTGCGDAKDDHGERGCGGDFGHCPCETWMPLTESPGSATRGGLTHD